jgi:hypothetical protein
MFSSTASRQSPPPPGPNSLLNSLFSNALSLRYPHSMWILCVILPLSLINNFSPKTSGTDTFRRSDIVIMWKW